MTDCLNPPEAFAERQFYSAHFMDPVIWEPFVYRVASQHDFKCKRILPGLPGTFPTFTAELECQDESYSLNAIVVKFFGPLFEGSASFQIERAMSDFLTQQPMSIRSPRILAEGHLSDHWDYLVFEHIPGRSIGQLRDEIPESAWEGVARQMGRFMKELHKRSAVSRLVITTTPHQMSWKSYVTFLETQRENCQMNHEVWHDLPPQLVPQLANFIPPIQQLLDYSSAPHWIHADLTGDHLLGRLVHSSMESTTTAANEWESIAIIDWGDSRIGNILYELVALHCDLFRANRHLLRLCLEAYGLPIFYQQDFTRKALSMMLLHEYPMPTNIYAPCQDTRTLDELAEHFFMLS